MESHCLQNGTWTPVKLTCTRDPNISDEELYMSSAGKFGGIGHNGNGGYLVGPGGQRIPIGLNPHRDGWTMIAISVVVAVILGTAVAFFILFVRRWFSRWTDTTSRHHLIIAPVPNNLDARRGPPGSGGSHNPGAGPSPKFGAPQRAPGNQYATMPLKPTHGKLECGNIYQTTTLSTFTMRGTSWIWYCRWRDHYRAFLYCSHNASFALRCLP